MGRGALMWVMLLAAPLAAAQPRPGSVRGEVRVLAPGPDGRLVPRTDASEVVVYLTGYTEPPPPEEVTVAQRNKTFEPAVLAIVAGQKVRFSNNDTVVHNVFSRSRASKFDAGKNRPGEVYTQGFNKPGIVDLYCDIHEKMVSTLVVVPNRAFAITGPEGHFVLGAVPPGTWSLFAVHRRDERSDVSRAEVTVKPGEATQVKLELTETRAGDEHPDKHGQPYTPRSDAY